MSKKKSSDASEQKPMTEREWLEKNLPEALEDFTNPFSMRGVIITPPDDKLPDASEENPMTVREWLEKNLPEALDDYWIHEKPTPGVIITPPHDIDQNIRFW